ncbi:MAG: hypothetical protein KBT01_01740, partial [Clostridiales bacterium]|nr:hypothetical protein [Candidatus Blautia equi]
VVNIAQENNVTIDPVILDKIVEVLEDIAKQDYDYDEMKETLEKVEGNLSGDENMQPVDEPLEGEPDIDIDDEDSIINSVNVNVLIQNGGPVLETSSEDPELEMSTGADITPEDEDDLFDDSEWDLSSDGWEDIVLDGTDNDIWNNPEEEIGGEVLDGTDNDVWFNPEEELGGEIIEDMPGEDEIPFDEGMDTETEDAINLNDLTDEQKEMFEHLENFCKGEFFGDAAALRDEMGDDAIPAATLNTEIAEKVTKDIQKMFFDVLKDGVDDYWVNPDDKYETPELDVLYLNLKDLFAIEGIMEPDQYMADVDAFDRELIFDDVMKFFEKLYGEEPVEAFDWSAATEMADNLDAVDDGMTEYGEITDEDLEVLD